MPTIQISLPNRLLLAIEKALYRRHARFPLLSEHGI